MSLEKEIKELICAGFSGIWVETAECDDAVATVRALAEERKWGFDVWDIDRQLYSGAVQAPGPLQAIRSMDLPKTQDTQILVLKNFHRYLPNPEVVQALAHVIVDREDHTEEEVRGALLSENFDEGSFWDLVAGVVDQLEYDLFPTPGGVK